MILKYNGVNKRAQVTVFVIVAIVVVVAVLGFLFLRGNISFGSGVPASLEPAYNYFLNCLEADTDSGVDILGSQGGYIYTEELIFDPGSSYMPFSSELNFLGNPVPYWYYVSGNGIQKEQIPSRNLMEEHLAKFVEDKIKSCDFNVLAEEGYVVEAAYTVNEPKASVQIGDSSVEVALDFPLVISKSGESATVRSHNVKVNSQLGKFYDVAREIYSYEQDSLFLENYGVDTLNAYAPVTGVDISCSPKIWAAENISSELRKGIEENTLSLKTEAGDYNLKDKEREYFVVPINSKGANVQFISLADWPYTFEVEPSEGNLLVASPVGNQPGLGVLGFCYVAYHYVYNVRYPVLVQIYSEGGEEVFQFPMAVLIQGNKPRQSLNGTAVDLGLPELCQYKVQDVQVSVYDSSLTPVDADIFFECLDTQCPIGKTTDGKLSAKFPQCVNGFISAKAKGYVDGRYIISTTKESQAEMILDKSYEKEIVLRKDGQIFTGNAVVSFIDKEGRRTKTIYYPEQKTVELSEGAYNIVVNTFSESTLKLQATTQEYCVDVPKGGIGSLFGASEKQCYTTQVPEQTLTSALSGGGKTNYFVLESELKNSNLVEMNFQSLPLPVNLEQLQQNYNLLDANNLEVMFR